MNLYFEAFRYANVEYIRPSQDRVSDELLLFANFSYI
jgi:hypothetical protein